MLCSPQEHIMTILVDVNNVGYLLMREMIIKENHEILKKPKFLEAISTSLENSLQQKDLVPDAIDKLVEVLLRVALARPKRKSAKAAKSKKSTIKAKPRILNKNTERKIKNLGSNFNRFISDVDGLKVLHAVCSICAPSVNSAIDAIPFSDQRDIAKAHALKTLKSLGDNAIESIISDWDTFTYTACMAKENDIACELVSEISSKVKKSKFTLNSDIQNHLIAATIQEFERRAGQKRKPRAGSDLQISVEVILEYLKVKLDPNPHLITGTLEADLVIKGANGYSCIVSCKRTGRERVKQVSVEPAELLKLRIRKIIWFFTEFDQSEDRVVDLGIRGSVFYLPDNSPEYKKLSHQRRTSKYVFPLSSIRNSLPKIVNGSISENNGF
jgi:hypothetical protein